MSSRTIFIIAVGVALAGAATAAGAQTYRWVDQSGRIHYSDTPPPPQAARQVEKRSLQASVIETSPLPYGLQQAAKANPVTLYTYSGCKEACANARRLLDKRGVPYKEVSVDEAAKREELKRVSGDTNVPVLVVGKIVKQGYEESMYNTALDEAGYPKSSQLLPGQQARQDEKPAPKPAAAAAPPEQPKGPYAPR
ncbi:MAG: glutaredoxin family protein [Burkholderiales bacterium]|nr:glutaredoxin family protein [Burkholderiales bacterium]